MWALLFLSAHAGAQSLPIQVVEAVDVPRVYRLDGVLEAINRSTVSSQTSGQVTEVLFDVDDLVDQGAVLVRLKDTEQKASVASAEANLASALAQRQDAQSEFERIKSVFDKQVVSKQVMDKASASLKSAKAAVVAAQANLKTARQQLQYTEIKAPYTGIVTERFVEVGEVASVGQPLMTGISLQQMRVEVDVPQSLIQAVRTKQEARVWLNGQWLEVTELTVFPVADRKSDTFRVRLQLPDGLEGAFPGMFVKVAISVGSRQVLAVPRSAVVYRSEVIGVYVLSDEGRVSLRHIRVGEGLPDGRQIVLSGLQAGEQVVDDPHQAVVALKDQIKERVGHE